MKPIALLTLLALAACSSATRPPLPVPAGDFRQANVGKWDWGENALTRAPRGAAAATGLVSR